MRTAQCTLAMLLVLVHGAGSTPTRLPLLDRGDASAWEERSFQGSTRYTAASADGVDALRAEARDAASGLYLERAILLSQWPVLRWRWRVSQSLDPGDERARSGDDFAARIYVVASHPVFFWKSRALCYVWAGREPVGATWPNPYTDNVMMVVLRSGDSRAGRWVEERRDVAADFRRAFGEVPHSLDAVAIMTDTDQSGGMATAWYDAIHFEPRAARPSAGRRDMQPLTDGTVPGGCTARRAC